MVKRIFVCSLICLFIFVLVACSNGGTSSKDTVTVKIGFQVIPNTEAIVKAKQWHEETMKGAKVEWLSFDSGRDVNNALASNSIDIGLIGSTLVATGISKGIDYQVIWLADVIGANEALVVKESSGINHMTDLKGKTIAVTYGSTTQYTLLGALKTHNIDPLEVKIVDLKPPDMLAAWKRGDIDGGYVWHPTLQNMVDDGGKILIHSGDLIEHGIVTSDTIVVRKKFAEEHPELVTAYIQSQMRAVDLYRNSPNEAIGAVAELFSISNEEAATMMSELVWLSGEEHHSDQFLGSADQVGHFADVLLDTAKFLQDQGLIDQVPDEVSFKRAIAPQYLEKALQGQGN